LKTVSIFHHVTQKAISERYFPSRDAKSNIGAAQFLQNYSNKLIVLPQKLIFCRGAGADAMGV